MKQIALKTIVGTHDGQPLTINYREQLKAILSAPMDLRSADLGEVRRSLRVLDALDAVASATHVAEADDSGMTPLCLEDADYEYLKQRVLAARWPIINAMVVKFVDDVTGG